MSRVHALRVLTAEKLTGLRDAIGKIHFPDGQADANKARERLKYDELFMLQLLLALKKSRAKVEIPGIPFSIESPLAGKLVDALPFKLTEAQKRVIREIGADMKSPAPMNRLIQGM